MAKQQDKVSENHIVPHSEDPLLSCAECGLLVGKTRKTVLRWIEEGLLRTVADPSGRRRVRKSELARWYGATALSDKQPMAMDITNNG